MLWNRKGGSGVAGVVTTTVRGGWQSGSQWYTVACKCRWGRQLEKGREPPSFPMYSRGSPCPIGHWIIQLYGQPPFDNLRSPFCTDRSTQSKEACNAAAATYAIKLRDPLQCAAPAPVMSPASLCCCRPATPVPLALPLSRILFPVLCPVSSLSLPMLLFHERCASADTLLYVDLHVPFFISRACFHVRVRC